MSARATWVDALRGLAVLLVLVWHVLTIGDDSRVHHGPIWEGSVALQGLRMPVLFFLSGLLLHRTVAKPLPEFALGKWANVVWPYLLWQLLALLMDPDLSVLRLADWGPDTYLWFLFYLAVCFACAGAMRRLPLWAMLVAAFGVFCIVAALFDDGSHPAKLALYAVWFFAGGAVGRFLLEQRPGFSPARAVALVCFCAAAWLNTSLAGFEPNPEANPVVFLLVSAPFVAAGALAALMVGSHRVCAPLQFVGMHSIVFYTAHFPVQVVVLGALRDTSLGGPVAAGLAFTASVLVCTALTAAAHVPVISALFRFPLPPRPVHLRGSDSPEPASAPARSPRGHPADPV